MGALTPRTKLILALPVIAALVIVLVYLRLFSSPIVIVFIFVAYLIVSLRNRRKSDARKNRENRSKSSLQLITPVET